MAEKLFQKQRGIFTLDKKDWGVVAIGVTIFAIISFWTITKSSIWFDEAFGAYLIQFDFGAIAHYTALDVHPPVYYWLLKLWSMLFGVSELGLRSMSVVFAGVAIVFGFLLTHRLFGRNAAWLSLVFMVLSPMLIRYGQEMRMYSLAAAIALAATYVLTYAVASKKRTPWIIYGVLVGVGMWTHYFMAIVWVAHWVWRGYTVYYYHKNPREFWKTFFNKEWIIAHVVAIGLFVPWLPALVRQVVDVQVNGFWIPPVTPMTLPNFFTNVLYYQDYEMVKSWLALLFMMIVVMVIALAIRLYQSQDAKQRQAYMLIFSLAFVPAMLLFVMSMPPLRPSFVDRYLVPSVVGVALFIGVTAALGATTVRPIWRRSIVGLVVAAMVIGIGNVYTLGNYNKTLHNSNNTRQIVESITARAVGGQPIIADSPWLFYEAVFYSTTEHPVYFIDATTEYNHGSLEMLRTNDQHKIKDLASFARQHPIVWYVGRPGSDTLAVPHPTWQPLQQITVNDSVNNQPAYKAIQYRIN